MRWGGSIPIVAELARRGPDVVSGFALPADAHPRARRVLPARVAPARRARRARAVPRPRGPASHSAIGRNTVRLCSMQSATESIEIELPGIGEPESLVVRRRTCRRPGQASSGWTRPASRSPSSRCGAASTTTSRRSRSCPATTWSARSTAAGPGVERPRRAAGRRGHQDRWLGQPRAARRRRPGAGAGRLGRGRRGDRRGQRHHRVADAAPDGEGPAGQTIVVLGANGGVGSTLVQLARHAGIAVIGTASPRTTRVRGLGATPSTTATRGHLRPDRRARAGRRGRRVRPRRRPRHGESWRLLRKGGTLVSYGSAATKDEPAIPAAGPEARRPARGVERPAQRPPREVLQPLEGQAPARDLLGGDPQDLEHVFALMSDGKITAQVAGRFALSDTAAALRFAESGGFTGKVVDRAGRCRSGAPRRRLSCAARVERLG